MTNGRPGVYITERLLPAPITVTGTANAAGAVIGEFAQGPTTATLVTSWYDFVKQFGGYNALYPATFGVGQFFQNGGSELYVQRVLHSDAIAASVPLPAASGNSTIATFRARNAGIDGNNLRVQLTSTGVANYFNLVVYKEGVAGTSADTSNDVVLESFNNVRFDDATSSDYAATVIGYSSNYVTLTQGTQSSSAPSTAVLPFTSGSDGTTPVLADYETALGNFENIDRPLVVFAAEVTTTAGLGATDGATFQDALISWAAAHNHFAVIDTPENLSVIDALTYSGARQSSSNAAVYYPHFFIQDPLGRSNAAIRKVGPAGAIAGLYINTDKTTGPFKAPAGIRASVRGAVALEKSFTAAELDALNTGAAPVNALRNLPGAGIVAMGARTLKQDGTANRYVNMRRSLIFIKKSLNDLTQFALFENNDEILWGRLRTSISAFLNDYRNQGGLRGATPAAAFFVKIDGENNTASTIANGEVHIEIGVALEYPAEFVVINLSQMTAA